MNQVQRVRRPSFLELLRFKARFGLFAKMKEDAMSADKSEHMGSMSSDGPKNSGIGAIPFLGTAIARSRVARLERLVSRFRVRTSEAAARLSSECARVAEIQAASMAAQDAAQNMNPMEREVLLRRVAEAERRMEGVQPLCMLRRVEAGTASPPSGELSGDKLSGDRR
jgi:hypothetical protein